MRIIAISRVRNEQDIVEAFIRHTLVHADKIVVMDDGSSDRTLAIIEQLQGEGLAVQLVRSRGLRRRQGDDLTELMHGAHAEDRADWVVPLDADEFIETPGGSTLRDHLPDASDHPFVVYWNNFAPAPDAKRAGGTPAAFTTRNRRRSELGKVLIPRAVISEATCIAEGNHFVDVAGTRLAAHDAPSIVLAHVPIRSENQYRYKVGVGTLRYTVAPSRDQYVWGWHYQKSYDAILNGDRDALREDMRATALNYSNEGALSDEDIVEQPLLYLGGPLRYSTSAAMTDDDLLAGILSYAHGLAKDLHAEREGPAAMRSKPGMLHRMLRKRARQR